MNISKPVLFIQFLAVCVFAFLINTLNVKHIRLSNPENRLSNTRSMVFDETIYSIDNEWYIFHMKHFLNGQDFSLDPSKPEYAVRRTPLYPLFYGMHYLIFGEAKSFAAIKVTQTIYFGISAVLLFLAVINFTGNRKIAWITYFIYGYNLTFISYLYYTITEAVSPALICTILFALSRCKLNPNRKNWFVVGFLFSVCVLFRPNIIFLIVPVLFLLAYYNRADLRRTAVAFAFFILGNSVLWGPWVIRNYIKTNGDIVLLEKYYGDQMSYGMPNMHLKYWIACYINPANYSSEDVSNNTIANIVFRKDNPKEVFIDSMMTGVPEAALAGNTMPDIREAYSTLYDYYVLKYSNAPARLLDSTGNIAIGQFSELKRTFIANAPLRYYILTPLSYVESLVFQSNSYTLAYLDDYQANRLSWIIKLVLYLLNVAAFASIPLLLFFYKKYEDLFWLALLFSSGTIFAIMVFNKNFESRYIYPFLPVLYITLSAVAVEFYGKLRRLFA